jgi:probable F420-dependent oxidoreductase
MKVRVGYGLGNLRTISAEQFGALADGLESHGFDSLWLSERVSGPAPEPLVALAYAAGRTSRIKFGTSVQVLPGRNPALLAKQWATLDVLSGGRALPAFGLGVAQPVEQQLFGVERKERAPWFEEALPLIRRFWSEDNVDHDGERFHYRGVTVLPHPTKPLDVWLGGKAPVELKRIGRLADGWLASFSTAADCAAGRVVIEEAAAAANREIDPEHFGAMVFYAHDELPPAFVDALRTRNPGADVNELVPRGWPAVREACERYVEVGFSKLVLVPMNEPKDWDSELAAAAAEVLPVQN